MSILRQSRKAIGTYNSQTFNEAKLVGRTVRKKPTVLKQNRLCRLAFAWEYLPWSRKQWQNHLFTDERKINKIGSDGKLCSPRTITEKHGGGSINLWGRYSWRGMCPVHCVNGIMDQHNYIGILKNIVERYADENLPIIWKLDHHNDSKHRPKLVQK